MIKTKSLLKKLSFNFPKKIAKKYSDFVGTMIGPLKEETNRVVLCLDFDSSILSEVEKIKPDLIITHHPFFFGSKTKILKYDLEKKMVYERLKSLNIPLISMHTNFDEGKEGMNDALANALGLSNIYAPLSDPMMRIGEITPMNIEDFALFAKEKLNVDYGLLINEGSKIIKKVGIIGGGGSRSFKVAIEEKCDIYISGDMPHHVRRDIILSKFNYLDVPHEVERIFMPTMKKILLSIDDKLEVFEINHEKEPKVI